MVTRQRVECYSRIVGYIRPVSQWCPGKVSEFKDRKTFKVKQLKGVESPCGLAYYPLLPNASPTECSTESRSLKTTIRRCILAIKGWKLQVHERDCHQCRICGSRSALTVHHKIAVARGGPSNLENTVCWCKTCHNSYHKKWGITTSDDYGNPIGEFKGEKSPKHSRVKSHKRRRGHRRQLVKREGTYMYF